MSISSGLVPKSARGFIAVCAAFATVSCSLFVEGTQPVTILASDKEADIRVDGIFIGRGQATAVLDKGESHSIVATKGDKAAYATVDYGVSTTGILDGVGSCLLILPVLGFISGGAWRLDTTHVNLHLQ